MAIEKKLARKPLRTFLENETISDIGTLLSAMQKKSIVEGLKNSEVFFPKICDLEIESICSRNRATIEISKKNSIDPATILEELARLVLEEKKNHKDDYAFVNLRFQMHAVQFLNGHLERDEENIIMPMHVILDSEDNTFVKVFRTYKENYIEGKDNFLDNDSFRNNDIIEGPLSQIRSWVKREKTEEEIANILGFNAITKDSESKFNGGKKDSCPAIRTCIHSEEILADDLASKTVQAYDLMKKLRKDPSYIIGITNALEIHVDSKRITISSQNKISEKTYNTFLAKILQLVGVKNFDSASVKYIKERYVEDSLVTKVKDSTLYLISDGLDYLADFLISKKTHTAVNLVLLLIILFSTLLLFEYKVPLLEAIIIAFPAFLVLALKIRASKEKIWINKIGQFNNAFYTGLVLYWSVIIYFHVKFNEYMAIFASIVVAIVVYKLIGRYGSKLLETKICKSFSKELISNRAVNVISILLVIITGIVGLISFGLLSIVLLIPFGIVFLVSAFLDRKFRNEYAYEKGRYTDRFFSTFKEERPELTTACSIRLKLSKCPKLLIWIPSKVFIREILKYGQRKYPKCLTIESFKKRGEKIVKKIDKKSRATK